MSKKYIYCKVSFENGGQTYYYRTSDKSIAAGDFVVVPVGDGNAERKVKVESVEVFEQENLPYPPEKTKKILRKADDEDYFSYNGVLEAAISKFNQDNCKENFVLVMGAIHNRLAENAYVMVPVEKAEDIDKMTFVGLHDPQKSHNDWDISQMRYRTMTVGNNEERELAFVMFTCQNEVNKGPETSVIYLPLKFFLHEVIESYGVVGVIINPWDESFMIPMEIIHMIFETEEKLDAEKQPDAEKKPDTEERKEAEQ